jgi:hypothetical protein
VDRPERKVVGTCTQRVHEEENPQSSFSRAKKPVSERIDNFSFIDLQEKVLAS